MKKNEEQEAGKNVKHFVKFFPVLCVNGRFSLFIKSLNTN